MKKLFILLIVIAMAFSMAACEDDQPEVNKQIGNDFSLYADYDFSANTIEKGAEYSFGLDDWNLYVATAISDKLVQIVRWDKSSSDEPNYEKDEEIGVFSIDDPSTGFIWLDETHTSFYITLEDEDKAAIKYGSTVVFSVSATSGSRNKGANYSSNVTNYLYEYSDRYWYRAIPLSDATIKVEAWRCYDGFLWDTWVYAYDVFVINTEKTTSDFAWTDDDCTSFSITMEDTENSGWDGKKLVYFLIDGDMKTPSQDGNGTTSGEVATLPPTTGENIINVTIECDENVMFSKYDLAIYLDDVYQAKLNHGENATYTFNLDDGTYKLTLCRADDSSVKGEVQFSITDSTDITYNAHCYSGSVGITQEHFESMRPLDDNETKVPGDSSDYAGKLYQSVVDSLESAGFTNIRFEILYDIVWGWTSEGEVDSVSIAGNKNFAKGDIFTKDVEIVITYHMWEDDDPSRIKMTKNADDYEGMDYSEVKKIFEELGFTNIVLDKTETTDTSYRDGEVYRITIDYEHFETGDTYKPDEKVLIKYYSVEVDVQESETTICTDNTAQKDPVSYSTNTEDTVRNGNAGIYAYKSIGHSYDIYWIIDFDEGYVYWFTEGNGDGMCDRLKIESGDLNSVLIITYHDGDSEWSYGLHFKWKNQPDHLVMQDNNGFEYDFYPTNLSSALSIRNSKTIVDH